MYIQKHARKYWVVEKMNKRDGSLRDMERNRKKKIGKKKKCKQEQNETTEN